MSVDEMMRGREIWIIYSYDMIPGRGRLAGYHLLIFRFSVIMLLLMNFHVLVRIEYYDFKSVRVQSISKLP